MPGQTFDVAAIFQVDKGKESVEKEIAEMDNFGPGKEHGNIPVGMPMGKVNSLDLFAVEVEGQSALEGEDRKCGVRGCFNETLAEFSSGRQAFANVGMGYNWGLGTEDAVATGVVAMEMGIEDVFEFGMIEIG